MWQPTSERWHDVTPGGRSAFVEALRRMFGDGNEWVLSSDECRTLEAAALATEGETAESFQALATAVVEHGAIRVRVEY